MSTRVDDGFDDHVAGEVAAAVVAGPQRLPAMHLTECQCCHSRVYFRARSSTPSTDPAYKVEYLFCPVCGATATQVREVEVLPKSAPKRRKVAYRYRA